jgi:DNA-binding MarR family transcriptional regulator
MNVLVAVRRMAEAKPQAICHVLQLEKSTLSRDVERMLARGWLESMPGEDARTIRVRVTPEERS